MAARVQMHSVVVRFPGNYVQLIVANTLQVKNFIEGLRQLLEQQKLNLNEIYIDFDDITWFFDYRNEMEQTLENNEFFKLVFRYGSTLHLTTMLMEEDPIVTDFIAERIK